MTFYLKGDDVADLTVTKTIFLRYRSSTPNNEYLIGSDGVDSKRGWVIVIIDNKVTFRNYYTATSFEGLESTVNVRDGSWHSIAITHDTSTRAYRLYVDGANVANAILNRNFLTGTRVAVGLKYWRGNLYGLKTPSVVDSIRVYTTTKTTTEIAALSNFQPELTELPITDIQTNGLEAEHTFNSPDNTPIEVEPDEEFTLINDFKPLELYTPKVLDELKLIQIENIALLEIEPTKIDLNDIGIIDIEDIEFDDTAINTVSITLPDLTTVDLDIPVNKIGDGLIPTVKIPEVDESAEVTTIDVIEQVEEDPIVDDTDTAPTDDKSTTITTTPRDDSRFYTALSAGRVKVDFANHSGRSNYKFITFWLKKLGTDNSLRFRGFGLEGILPLKLQTYSSSNGAHYHIEDPDPYWYHHSTGSGFKYNNLEAFNLTNFKSIYGNPSGQMAGGKLKIPILYFALGNIEVKYLTTKEKASSRRSSDGNTTSHNYTVLPFLLEAQIPYMPFQIGTLDVTPRADWVHYGILFGPDGLQIWDSSRTSNKITSYSFYRNMPTTKGQYVAKSALAYAVQVNGGNPLGVSRGRHIHRNRRARTPPPFEVQLLQPMSNPEGINLTPAPFRYYGNIWPGYLDYKKPNGTKAALRTIADYRTHVDPSGCKVVFDAKFVMPPSMEMILPTGGDIFIDDLRVYDASQWSQHFLELLAR